MPAALNIQPKKRADLKGMVKHDFRQYLPEDVPRHIDASRLAYNRILYGSADALDNLPERQPTPDAKSARTPMWLPPWCLPSPRSLQEDCPGRLAYAVLHQDESRPQFQAA